MVNQIHAVRMYEEKTEAPKTPVQPAGAVQSIATPVQIAPVAEPMPQAPPKEHVKTPEEIAKEKAEFDEINAKLMALAFGGSK